MTKKADKKVQVQDTKAQATKKTKVIRVPKAPIVWTNVTAKKGDTTYYANGIILYCVERINKSGTASIYIHQRLNSKLGEPNGNKRSKYSRRLRGPVDEVFKAVDAEARTWAEANLLEYEDKEVEA